MPAFGEAERARLLAEIRELPARHLVQVDLGGRRAHVGLERGVLGPHHLPVVGDLPDTGGVEAGVARLSPERFHHGAETGLRGEPRKAVHREVDGIDARLHRGEHARPGDARRIVGMEMHRKPGLFLQRLDQLTRGGGLDEPRHVLDAENVGARFAELAGHAEIVVAVVPATVGSVQIPGVANGRLADPPGLEHRVDRDPHVLDRVQGVEDAEEVDPGGGGPGHEPSDHVVRIIRVANCVRGAHQHLEKDVGDARAQAPEPLPRTLAEEAQRHVERRSSPAFEREEIREVARIGIRDPLHVVGAHPGREERLRRIAHRGVGDEDARLAPHPLHHRGRPLGVEQRLCSGDGRFG